MIKHIITNHPNFEVKSFKEYINDILVREERYNDKGQLHGIFRRWYLNGQLAKQHTYKNDVRNGTFSYWYENGQVRDVKKYKDGKLHGTCCKWHENGQLENKCSYKDGKLHGLFKEWDKDGNSTATLRFKNGGASLKMVLGFLND